ncbi:hypothetical protein BDZ97DRAFT_1906142 [Flammula alnicola]|nr:hypothetical protein BDZ97DRAFT_1906142 [Flammula alnicola]
MLLLLLGGLAFLPYAVLAAIVTQVQDLPGLQYDFVVVGGGTAGNVIANRLTENPGVSVLVLEAVFQERGHFEYYIPFFCTRATPFTSVDWNYTTVPQTHLNDRVIAYPRGFVLGGSSSVNYMAYTRGSQEDYDRYARLSGDPGWSWDALIPYMRKNEIITPPADHHNTTGQFNPAVHGFNGINSVISVRPDYNSGFPIGIGWTQYTIKDGARSSSATSYLGPPFIGRPNLHVLLHAHASRILSSGSVGGQPVLQTVEFVSASGAVTQVTARKEVILSAGSVNTPQILLHSGIGDTTTLSQFGIKTLVNNPSVGKNMSDHPIIANQWNVDATQTFEAFTHNATATQDEVDLWQNTRTGVLASSPFNNLGWVRFPANSSIFQIAADPSAGPHTPHVELLIANGDARLPFPTSGHLFSVSTVFLTPTSRGSVTINSANPFDAPVIDINFLATDFDVAGVREAVRTARRFTAAPAFANYTTSNVINATTDAEIDAYVRANVGTLFHPVGTAAMSPKNSGFGVVDPDLRVKGVVGLRIVDASVVPVVPSAHTQFVTYVFAERGADLIKALWHI